MLTEILAAFAALFLRPKRAVRVAAVPVQTDVRAGYIFGGNPPNNPEGEEEVRQGFGPTGLRAGRACYRVFDSIFPLE